MSPPRAGAVTARLLAAPHLIHRDWLLGASSAARPSAAPDVASLGAQFPAPAADPADQDRNAAADELVWPRTQPGAVDHGGGRDAVPFAAATPVAPAVAGRLAAAVRALGERVVLGCAVTPARSDEATVTIPADGARIHAALQTLGTPDALVVLPDLSAALLTTSAGFAVAAGPRQFVEAVAGADVRRARTGFAEFALASAGTSAQPLSAARYYGCALSGRAWRPVWLAWSSAVEVPYGSGIGGQLVAMRQFVDGRLSAADFGQLFRAARTQEMRAGERATGSLAAALDDTGWALDGYVPSGRGYPWAPGQLGLDGLREAVSVALSGV